MGDPGGATPLWTASEIAAATGGAVYGGLFDVSGVSIDTRTLQEGDLFVALAGARDGESFASTAAHRGAGGLLTRRVHEGAPGVAVDEGLKALERLGAAARTRSSLARRCAVTGSVGKTSVTQALGAALRASGPAHSSVESYNNHIGVPLTLARMPKDTKFAAFELGMNHAGEIADLSRQVRPHVAVVTTIGTAHMENFPEGEVGVARAKAEIFEGLAPGGRAILNADAPFFELLKDAALAKGAEVWSFGSGGGAFARLLTAKPDAHGLEIKALIDGQPVTARVAAAGAHWALNVLAVLLAVKALGADTEAALDALARFSPLAGRGEQVPLRLGDADVLLLDESYNANPQSMRAALATLKALPARGRKIAVLTDMLEIGDGALEAHIALKAPLADAGVERVFASGALMGSLIEVLQPNGVWRAGAEDLAPEVISELADGDVVMVKGSKGSKAAFIVTALKAAALGGGSPVEGR